MSTSKRYRRRKRRTSGSRHRLIAGRTGSVQHKRRAAMQSSKALKSIARRKREAS